MKPKLLVVEIWAMGDLVLTTPFLRAATAQYEVTLLAKPMALELQPRLWPGVDVVPFTFPWTAFSGKYRLLRWPWGELTALMRRLRSIHFDAGVSARWDPRDHLLLRMCGAGRRIGFPYVGSGVFLSERLALPAKLTHRYECWRLAGGRLGINLPPRNQLPFSPRQQDAVLIHTGAAQKVRVWPLERFQFLAGELRKLRHRVQIVCDAGQREWWASRGENAVVAGSLAELMGFIDQAGLFVGNDSGPGHIAAVMGVPTFTIFGNNFPDLFAPLHGGAEWMEGGACPYKPCFDSCRFAQPNCILSVEASAVWAKLKPFVEACQSRGKDLKQTPLQ